MRNKLTDLNDVLFEQIERINDDNLHGKELEEQIKKSKAITEIAGVIVGNAKTAIEAAKLASIGVADMPKYLSLDFDKKESPDVL